MSISWLSSKPTPIVDYEYDDSDDDDSDDDDDDDVTVLYSTPPSNNNKGKAIQTDYDDEIQIIFDSSSNCGNKKRKFSNIGDQDQIFAETLFQKEQLEAKKVRNLNIYDQYINFRQALFEKEKLESKNVRNLDIYDQYLIFRQTLFEKEKLETKNVRNLDIYDQDLIFEEPLSEKEQLNAKKLKSLAISDEDLIFQETLFEENQLEDKKWRKLNIDDKELSFVDTLVEKDHVEAKKVRQLNIDDDGGDEVEVLYSKHENGNFFGKLGAIKDEILVEKDQMTPEKEGKFDIDAELQLIYSFPEIYLPEFSNLKHESVDLFGEIGVDDANGDEDEVILPSSSKGKGILVENDQLKANNGRSLTFDDDDDDDDEVQVSNLCPEIYVGESSKSKHENDNLLEKVGVDDATGDLSLLVMCEICTDEKPKVEFLTVMGCDHSYCSECVARYVASKLQENVVEITCPVSECAGVLGPEHCRSILPADVYDRWGLALCEEIISPSQKFYCPYNDCSALMIDDTQETGEVITRMECPNCQRMFCVKCKVSWHNGVECEEFQRLNEDERGQGDIMLVKLAKKNLWKRCPKCKMYVQRSQGCNAMRCRCGCQFCYACGNLAQTCHCIGGYAHRLTIEHMTPHAIPPLNNLHVNQTLTNPPDQFPQGEVGVPSFLSLRARLLEARELQRTQLLNLSANQTQYHPSAHYPQGPVGGSLNSSQARRGPVEDGPSVSQARRDSVGGGLDISQARQSHVVDYLDDSQAFQDLVMRGLNISQARQGPVGGGRNNSEARQGSVAGGLNNSEARHGPVGGGRNNSLLRQGHVIGGLNISQGRQDPVEDGLNLSQSTQGPVGGGRNNSLRRQGYVIGGLNISQARQDPVEDGLNLSQANQGPVGGGLNISQARQGSVGGVFTPSQVLQQQHRRMPGLMQNLSANQTHPNPASQFPQGHVGGRDNTSQARQGPVGGRDNTSQARQLRRIRMLMALQNHSTNQTQPNPSSQFGQIRDSVGGRNNTSQARQRLERMQSRMLYGLQNLSGNQTLSNANIQPAESSTSNQ